MPGRIIQAPTPAQVCRCDDKPPAEHYAPGTIWECDICHKQWVVITGSQYNEVYYAWRRADAKPIQGEYRG